jgi:hypothetical protein
MRIVRLIVWITIMAHISACIWFVVGGISAGTGVSAIQEHSQAQDDALQLVTFDHRFCIHQTLCTLKCQD